MKTCYYILALTLCLGYLGCSKEEAPEMLQPPVEGEIRLDELQLGQKSTFQMYTGTCEDISEVNYTGDRIELEVIQQDGALALRETLDPESPSYYDGYEPVIYPVDVREDHLFIPERAYSALFFFYGNDKIMINPSPEKTLRQDGCLLLDGSSPFVGNSIAEAKNINLQVTEEHDQIVVSCVPNFDIDAYLIYDQYQLQASHTVITSEFNGDITTEIRGWSLVDQK